ncbi:hypothetical protein [Bradyrhizobium monzae]|uniref:hypothetical protein n=1 Tax=Bradyrhizobium sp. Oc8 TaxID=2876780 RepID=UPI001F478CC6|nr:hypothetical protein [Bradyrhizobium sp. Oc8]
MAKSDRLNSILEKQDAADRAHVAELARQAMADHGAKEARTRVINEWRHVCRVLTRTVNTANDAMTGSRKLYLQHWIPTAADSEKLADAIIMFAEKHPDDVQRNCVVSGPSRKSFGFH